jgi:hypothetical protein
MVGVIGIAIIVAIPVALWAMVVYGLVQMARKDR